MRNGKCSIGAVGRRVLAPVRDQRDGEKGIALMSAIFFMVALTGLTAVLLGVILGQTNPSFAVQKSTKTVDAAQAGLQAGLGALRAATTGIPDITTNTVYGARAMLPCVNNPTAANPTFTGNVDGSTSAVSYSVTIQYFTSDPTGLTTAQMAAADLSCSAVANTATAQPTYAVVTSTGAGTANSGGLTNGGSRTVSAIYQFRVSNINIPGGRIWDSTSHNYCLKAVTATSLSQIIWTAASNCTSANDATELWIYDTDYQIKLASTKTALNTGLCVTGPVNSSGAVSTSSSIAARLVQCATLYSQLWSWNDGSTWRGQQNPRTAGYANSYIAYSTVAEGSVINVSTSSGGTFSPEYSVGAGAASKNTNQLVNYLEFGRCADVTEGNINYAYMISYPCKQDPSGPAQAQLNWNHKWYYTEPSATSVNSLTQQITVNPGTVYCYQTPLNTSTSTYPTFTTGCAGNPVRTQWTRYQETGDSRTSYTIQDTYGRCLTAESGDLYFGSGQYYSKLTVEPCTGGLKQKWNAPAAYSDAYFGSYREVSGG